MARRRLVEARIGIHTGEPESTETSLVGIDVHRAARICAAGHGGQVLLSVTTHELLGGDPPRDDLPRPREHRLKDLERPNGLPGHGRGHARRVPADPVAGQLAEQPAPPAVDLCRAGTSPPPSNEQLGTTPLLTLVGPGGVGKTRLALEAAAQAMDAFPDGAWVVEFAALGDDPSPRRSPRRSTSRRSRASSSSTRCAAHRERRILLVFDDCDHVIEAVATAVDDLLRACSGLRVLVTSREALGIAGESLYPVASLELPAPDPVVSVQSVETIGQVEAVRLFVDRARAVQPAFVLTERNVAAVAQICRRLDGILAIELAAARVKAIPPEQIAARLDDRFRFSPAAAAWRFPVTARSRRRWTGASTC